MPPPFKSDCLPEDPPEDFFVLTNPHTQTTMSKKERLQEDGTYAPSTQAAGLLASLQMTGMTLVWREAKGGMLRNAWLTSENGRYNFSYEPEIDQWRIWDRKGHGPSVALPTRLFVDRITIARAMED